MLKIQRKRETAEKLILILQFCQTPIHHLVVLLAFPCYKDVIHVRKHVLLAKLVNVIFMVQTQRLYRKLLGVIFLVNKRILQFSVILKHVVARSIRYIPLGKQTLVQIGRSHSTSPQTDTFYGISTDCRVHRPKVKLAHFLRASRNIAGNQNRNHLFRPIENGNRTQLRQQFFYGVFIFLNRNHAVLLPVFIRHEPSIRKFYNLTFGMEYGIGCRSLKRIIPIVGIFSCIQPLRSGQNRELHRHVVLHFQPTSIGSFLKILLYQNIVDIVQINGLRHIQLHLFNKHGSIILRHIQTAEKSECAVVERRKAQFDAAHAVDVNRIRQIIFIEVRADS